MENKETTLFDIGNAVEVINNKVLTTSKKLAERFDKRHDHILRDITNIAKDLPEFGEMFFETRLPDIYGRLQPAYYINKDGFSLLAMGFTGKKAIQWKVAYLKTFNRLTAHLLSTLYPRRKAEGNKLSQLEITAANAQALVEQAKQLQSISDRQIAQEKKIEKISNVVQLNVANWRKETTELLTQIAKNSEGDLSENAKELRKLTYAMLNERLGISLSSRLSRYKKRMTEAGTSHSKTSSLNYLDVIGEDKKLVEGYIAIVKELSIANIGKAA